MTFSPGDRIYNDSFGFGTIISLMLYRDLELVKPQEELRYLIKFDKYNKYLPKYINEDDLFKKFHINRNKSNYFALLEHYKLISIENFKFSHDNSKPESLYTIMLINTKIKGNNLFLSNRYLDNIYFNSFEEAEYVVPELLQNLAIDLHENPDNLVGTMQLKQLKDYRIVILKIEKIIDIED